MKPPLRITPQVQIVDPSGRTTRDGFNLFQNILDQLQTDSGPIGTALQPSDIGVTVQAHSAVLDATTASYTAAKDSKLAGIAAGATANSSDAFLLARANHTGTQLAATISDFSTAADLRIAAAASTGTGSIVRATSPVLVTPALGTPSALVLTNATGTPSSIGLANGTGLPVSTGISGLGTGIAAFLATPSSANLATAVTDESGTGVLPFLLAGTFTPTVAFATPGTSSFAYATQEGRYLKIGTLVFIKFRVIFTPTIGTGSGNFLIASLPVLSNAVLSSAVGGGTVGNSSSTFAWPAGVTSIALGVNANSTTAIIQGSGSAINTVAFTQANLTGGSAHTISGIMTYEA